MENFLKGSSSGCTFKRIHGTFFEKIHRKVFGGILVKKFGRISGYFFQGTREGVEEIYREISGTRKIF